MLLTDSFGRVCSKTTREAAQAKYNAVKALGDRARAAGRGMTAVEINEQQTLSKEADILIAEAQAYDHAEASRVAAAVGARVGTSADMLGTQADYPTGDGPPDRHASHASSSWVDVSTGKAIKVYGKGQSLSADIPAEKRRDLGLFPLGAMIVAMATGRREFLNPGVKAAMSEGANSGGGFLVPDPLWSTVIDAARARAVLSQAGMVTVPMESDTLRLVNVHTDPTFEIKAENSAFTGSDVVFGATTLVSFTGGTLCTLSRELAEDAPNAAEVIQQTMERALASEIDRLGLNGSGGTEPLGLLGKAGIGSTGSVGAIQWEDFANAIEALETLNEYPNAYIVHPAIRNDLSLIASGDGVNSAKTWLGPPANVGALTQFSTTNMPLASAAIGDFSKLVFGVRQRPLVEITNVGGGAFEKHQLLVKITWSGDFGLLRPAAFHALAGITS